MALKGKPTQSPAGSRVMIVSVVLVTILILAGMAAYIFIGGVDYAEEKTPDALETAIDGQILSIAHQLIRWSRAYVVLRSTAIFGIILSTVLASFMTVGRAQRFAIVMLILTASASAATSLLSAFHVRENALHFKDLYVRVLTLEDQYRSERDKVQSNQTALDDLRARAGAELTDIQNETIVPFLNFESDEVTTSVDRKPKRQIRSPG